MLFVAAKGRDKIVPEDATTAAEESGKENVFMNDGTTHVDLPGPDDPMLGTTLAPEASRSPAEAASGPEETSVQGPNEVEMRPDRPFEAVPLIV